jgi:hypothetical protein
MGSRAHRVLRSLCAGLAAGRSFCSRVYAPQPAWVPPTRSATMRSKYPDRW